MTIRYKCKKCESPMSIRDDKAGKPAKCPKCQTEFIVPQPREPEEVPKQDKPEPQQKAETAPSGKTSSDSGAAKSTKSNPSQKSPSKSGQQQAAAAKSEKKSSSQKAQEPAEFDPADFLLGGDGSGSSGSNKTAPMATPPPAKEAASQISQPESKSSSPPKSEKKKRKPAEPPKPISANRADDRDTFEETDEDRRARLREVYGSTSAEIAASALSSTADSAEILLDAAMDDSRRKAAEDIEEQKRGPDYSEVASYFGINFVLPALGVIVGVILLYYASDYMMGGGLKIPPLGKVTGVVKLDGKPLPNATVTFIPVQEQGGVRENVRAATGVTDDQGKYTLQYTEGVKGTAVGINRVEITATSPEGVPLMLPGYGTGSRQSREVESGSQEIDFVISTQ